MKNIIFNIFIRKNFNIMALFFIFTITGCSNNAKNDDPILTHSFKEQYVNYILVPVVIKGETYTFLLDTGSSSSIIDKRLADKFTHKLKGMPDPYKEYFSNVNQIFSENMNNSFAIGMSTLDSFEQYLISPDRMLLCYNLAKPPKPLLQKFRNINLRTFNNNIELFYNKESVLSEFNLKNGDIIISVNGVKYPKNAVLEVKNKINTLPKGQVTLSI